MSQGNVELWRASIEDVRMGIREGANELDREAFVSQMAELCDADIEWDVSAAETLDALRAVGLEE